MMGLGVQELLILLAIIVILFGAAKLPALGGAIGESIRNFKKGIKEEYPSEAKTKIVKMDTSDSKTHVPQDSDKQG